MRAEVIGAPETSAPTARVAGVAGGLKVWRSLVRLHRDMERGVWGRLLLGNLWPAYLFALPLAVRVWGFAGRLGSAAPRDTRWVATTAQELVTIVFLLLVVVLFILRRPVSGQRAEWRGGLAAIGGTFLLNVVGFLPGGEPSTQALLISTLVIVLGTAFTTWSLAILGRCFGMLPEARGLVMRGPYKLVRHPVYLGELTSAFGLLIVKPEAALVALYVVFAALQWWRIGFEERALAAAFPAEYPAYAARTPRLVPRWR